MAKRAHTLDEKFDLAVDRQLLTGTQAIVRLMLMQKARDRAAGLNTGRLRHRLSRLADRDARKRVSARRRR